MVGNYKITVGSLEGTVAFIAATDFLKAEKNVSFKKIAEVLGLKRSQLDMVRIKRRYLTRQEIDKFLQEYPETARFFQKHEPGAGTSNQTDEIREPGYLPAWVDALLKAKDEIIELSKEQRKWLEDANRRLEDENKALRAKLDLAN